MKIELLAKGWQEEKYQSSICFVRGHVRYNIWSDSCVDHGRWYWNRQVNGRITADGSYKYRRSARRAVQQMMEREG